MFWDQTRSSVVLSDSTVLSHIASIPDTIGEAVSAAFINDRYIVCDKPNNRLICFHGSTGRSFGPYLHAPYHITLKDSIIHVFIEPDEGIEPAVLTLLDMNGSMIGSYCLKDKEDTLLSGVTDPDKIMSGCLWNPIISHVENVTVPDTGSYSYTLETKTTADYINTAAANNISPLYENNISYSIENISSDTVTVKKLIANGHDWSCLEGIMDMACGKAKTQEEKALSIWDFIRKNTVKGVTWPRTGVVRFYNGYGTGVCGTFNGYFALLSAAAGIKARTGSLSNGSHAVTELFFDGRNHFLDTLYGACSPYKGSYIRDSLGNICSYEQLCEDHYLVNRSGTVEIGELASLFGYADSWSTKWKEEYKDPYTIEYTLKPGEIMGFGFGSDMAAGYKSIFPKSDLRRYTTDCPYPVIGVIIKGKINEGSLDISVNGKTETVSSHSNTDFMTMIPLKDSLTDCKDMTVEFMPSDAKYSIEEITVCFTANRLTLPRLHFGVNSFDLVASLKACLRITQRYKESLPYPLASVILDHKDGSMPFTWTGNKGCIYDFILSDRDDFAWPYAPVFSQTVDNNRLDIDCSKLLVPSKRYFWRVRAAYETGIWGPWSKPGSFIWDAPKRIDHIEFLQDGRSLSLSWEKSRDAEYYEVYGSDEQGFDPHMVPYEVWVNRRSSPAVSEIYPKNHIADTVSPSFDITGEKAAHKAYCYYRVCAVDKNGARSAPSPYVSCPHPYIVKGSIRSRATAGKEYSGYIASISSFGQLHFNRLPERPMYTHYLDQQILKYSIKGPPWLGIRSYDGYMSGTPGKSDIGINTFVISAEDQCGVSDEITAVISVSEA